MTPLTASVIVFLAIMALAAGLCIYWNTGWPLLLLFLLTFIDAKRLK